MKKLGIFIILQCALALSAAAQALPPGPLRIVVAGAAGGPEDIHARRLASRLSLELGRSVAVQSKPDEDAFAAARAVAGAPADGATLLFGGTESVIAELLADDACCRLGVALLPVSRFTLAPLVMVVHPSVDARSFIDYIELAKRRAGHLTYASGGPASLSGLVGRWIEAETGVELLAVRYKPLEAVAELVSGRVTTAFVAPSLILSAVNASKLRAIAVLGPERVRVLPDVPTLKQDGLPGVQALAWTGVFVPAGTPRATIALLHRALVRAFEAPEVREQVASGGAIVVADGPVEFEAFLRAEKEKWAHVIRETRIK